MHPYAIDAEEGTAQKPIIMGWKLGEKCRSHRDARGAASVISAHGEQRLAAHALSRND